MPIRDFANYIVFLLKKWNHMFGIKDGASIKEICQSVYIPPAPGKQGYSSPQKYMTELYKHFGVTPVRPEYPNSIKPFLNLLQL